MAPLTTQEKILRQLQAQIRARHAGGESPDEEEGAARFQQTALGNKVISWKDRLQQWGVLHVVKKVPLVSEFLQKRYWRMTQAHKVVSVPEQVCFNGEEFVQKAYNAILERQPDPAGLKYYLQMLRNGTPKEMVLYFLARSPEARQYNVQFDGLTLPPLTLWKHKVKQAGKRILVFFPGMLWFYKFLRLPGRFYTLVQTVQELQDRVERLERESEKK
jgi:hypothetical protein